MSATAETAPAPEATPKKTKATKAGGAKKKGTAKPASHPPTNKMVVAAITALKERGGSSMRAIKKYISSTYKVDADRIAPFIKRYLKSAVADGTLIQTKGSGAAGSFKVASKGGDSGAKVVKKKRAAKPKGEKGTATPKPKKAAAAKKPKAKKSPSAASKIKKKTAKTPTKPKAPKPKKATAAKKGTTVKKSPKKAAAKKPAKK